MSVTFTPTRDGILLALEPSPPKSQIIAVAGGTEDLVRFGKIVAVGPEVRDATVGQRVLASITAGVEIQNEVQLIEERNILGVVV